MDEDILVILSLINLIKGGHISSIYIQYQILTSLIQSNFIKPILFMTACVFIRLQTSLLHTLNLLIKIINPFIFLHTFPIRCNSPHNRPHRGIDIY